MCVQIHCFGHVQFRTTIFSDSIKHSICQKYIPTCSKLCILCIYELIFLFCTELFSMSNL